MTEADSIHRLQQFLRINTSHPDPNYESCIEFLTKIFHDIQVSFQIFRIQNNKPVFVATLPGTDSNKGAIAFSCHMDVVPVGDIKKWKSGPFEAKKFENGDIVARGAQDMKSIGVMSYEAIRILKKAKQRMSRTIHFMFLPDEEIGGEDGMSCFADTDAFKNLRIDVLFDEGLASPTNTITVFYGERAPWWLKLTANGQMAHGSQFIINSAMANMLDCLDHFKAFSKRMIEESTIHGKSVGETPTCNITMLNGGYQTNIVPDVVEARIDIRLPPSVNKENFEALVETWTKPYNVKVEFINKWMDGTTSPTDGPFFGCIDQTFKEMGIEYELDIFRGATDSRFVRRKGILAYNVSPMRNTPILLHDYNEFINEAVFFEGIDFYKILIPKVANI